MRRRSLTVGACLILAGCAHSSVVLLADEDGGHGEVGIQQAGAVGETVVREANMRATLGGARPSVRPLGANGLKPHEAALLASLPPASKSFALYFRQGTTDMTEQSLPMVEAIRAEFAKRPGAEIQVTGHTDTVGSHSDNDRLSRERAEEILNLLASKGFSRDMMSAVGRGERELKEPTSDNVGSPVNRRVVVIVR